MHPFSLSVSGNILIVDDEKDIRQILSIQLSALKDCRIFEASSGKEAYELLNKHAIDVIISDLKMPGIDGMGFLKLVGKSLSSLPFIFISAFTDNKNIQEALSLGAFDFLPKPFERSEVIGIVCEALSFRNRIKAMSFDHVKHHEFCALSLSYMNDGFFKSTHMKEKKDVLNIALLDCVYHLEKLKELMNKEFDAHDARKWMNTIYHYWRSIYNLTVEYLPIELAELVTSLSQYSLYLRVRTHFMEPSDYLIFKKALKLYMKSVHHEFFRDITPVSFHKITFLNKKIKKRSQVLLEKIKN